MSSVSETFDAIAARVIFLNNWLFVIVLGIIAAVVYYKTRDWKR
jgi:hypothetical protein